MQRELDSNEDASCHQIPTCDWFEEDHNMVTFKIKLPSEDAPGVINAINRIDDQLYAPGKGGTPSP